RRLVGALALGVFGCAPITAQQGPTPAPSTSQSPAAPGSAAPTAPGKATLRKFAEVTKDAKVQTGFFDTYEKDGRVYVAVPQPRLNEDFLLSFQVAQGIGARGLFGGTMLSLFEPAVVALERHNDRVFLVQK